MSHPRVVRGAGDPRITVAPLMLILAACGGTPAEPPPTEQAALKTAAAACAPGTRCLKVTANGALAPSGTSLAQCSGTFPDYIVPASLFPANYQGPWFQLSQNYPSQAEPETFPWQSIDFRKSKQQADAYLFALRDYAFDGMIEADFRPEKNTKRAWFHVPLMNFGNGRRELVHGLTAERSVKGPELGVKTGTTIRNYAIGFYNQVGGFTIGQVWKNPEDPALLASRFPEGAMVFKILFTAGTKDDFQDPGKYPAEGAPEWQIATGNGQLTTVRLLQMDVAARDKRAAKTGWVFGTFAFDPTATDPVAWRRLRPVGLMWGNDPGYTPAKQQQHIPLKQGYVSDQIPAYAAAHLGWAGRVNGPVDNPISACMSCHSTAQYPVDAALAPFSAACQTDQQKLHWFRNLAGSQAFGGVDSNCQPQTSNPPPVALDYSLQMQVAVQSLLQFNDVNSCRAGALGVAEMAKARTGSPVRKTDAPRIMR